LEKLKPTRNLCFAFAFHATGSSEGVKKWHDIEKAVVFADESEGLLLLSMPPIRSLASPVTHTWNKF
jgi:hypothetical protein